MQSRTHPQHPCVVSSRKVVRSIFTLASKYAIVCFEFSRALCGINVTLAPSLSINILGMVTFSSSTSFKFAAYGSCPVIAHADAASAFNEPVA